MTTTIGIKTKESVIIATDRRVSAGESFIASKQGEKIHQIDKQIGVAIAGLVADAQNIIDRLRAEFRLYRYERGYEMRIEPAAQFIGKVFHGYYRSGAPLYAQLLIAGFDPISSVPHIYLMDPSGALIPDDRFISSGSGSQLSYGVLEGGYKDEMSLDEAQELALKAMLAAIERNPHTGDGIDMACITKDGYKKLTDEEISVILRRLK
ncbi:MAG: proteasome subunit beta [Candidatus Helarchaeales archaeon]